MTVYSAHEDVKKIADGFFAQRIRSVTTTFPFCKVRVWAPHRPCTPLWMCYRCARMKQADNEARLYHIGVGVCVCVCACVRACVSECVCVSVCVCV